MKLLILVLPIILFGCSDAQDLAAQELEKKAIDKLCEKNGIKLTTFFNSLSQVAIEESNGKGDLQKIEARRLADERVKHLNQLIDGHNLDMDNAVDIITERNRLVELFDLGDI